MTRKTFFLLKFRRDACNVAGLLFVLTPSTSSDLPLTNFYIFIMLTPQRTFVDAASLNEYDVALSGTVVVSRTTKMYFQAKYDSLTNLRIFTRCFGKSTGVVNCIFLLNI